MCLGVDPYRQWVDLVCRRSSSLPLIVDYCGTPSAPVREQIKPRRLSLHLPVGQSCYPTGPAVTTPPLRTRLPHGAAQHAAGALCGMRLLRGGAPRRRLIPVLFDSSLVDRDGPLRGDLLCTLVSVLRLCLGLATPYPTSFMFLPMAMDLRL